MPIFYFRLDKKNLFACTIWTCCPADILIKWFEFDLKISCNSICIALFRTSLLYQFCISLYFFTGTGIVRRIYHLRDVALLWKNLRHEKSRNWQTTWVSNNTPRSSQKWYSYPKTKVKITFFLTKFCKCCSLSTPSC